MKKLLVVFAFVMLLPIGVSAQVTVLSWDTAKVGSVSVPQFPERSDDGLWGNDGVYGGRLDSGSAYFDWPNFARNFPQFTTFDVYFSAPIAGHFYDSTHWTFGANYHGIQKVKNVVELQQAIAIQDSQLRVRPRSWSVDMRFSPSLHEWIGTSQISLNKQNVVDCLIDSIHVETDTIDGIHTAVDERGSVFHNKLLSPGEQDKAVMLLFRSTRGRSDTELRMNGFLETSSHSSRGDSVFKNPVSFHFNRSPKVAGVDYEFRSSAEGGKDHLILVPNPANARMTVVSDAQIMSIRLLDCIGRIVLERSGGASGSVSEVDTHSLPSGAYLLVVQSGGSQKSIRVEVEH